MFETTSPNILIQRHCSCRRSGISICNDTKGDWISSDCDDMIIASGIDIAKYDTHLISILNEFVAIHDEGNQECHRLPPR